VSRPAPRVGEQVRYIGWSNVTGWQLQKIVETSKRLGLTPCISLQAQYSLLVSMRACDVQHGGRGGRGAGDVIARFRPRR